MTRDAEGTRRTRARTRLNPAAALSLPAANLLRRKPSHDLTLRFDVLITHFLIISKAVIGAMARSKRRRGPWPPTLVWRRNDINILLACLDYSLQHKLDFNKIAITQIRKRTGKQVTTALIQQALKRETRLYGREGRQLTVEDLVSEGSLFLEGYTDDDRENIREEVNRTEASGNHYWLRSVSLESPSRSRTLSVNYCQRSEV